MNKIPMMVLAALIPAGPVLAQTAESTDEAKIADAIRAAWPEVTDEATILDWPDGADGDFRVIRQGTNGWSCLPDMPGDSIDEPQCLDDEWLEFTRNFLAGRPHTTTRTGLAYTFNAQWAASNTDAMATEPAPGNQWHEGGSHLRMLVPDLETLDGFPTEPTPNGGAYVMWKGTPYVHLMIPIPESHTGGPQTHAGGPEAHGGSPDGHPEGR
jgi:hypothetical protein